MKKLLLLLLFTLNFSLFTLTAQDSLMPPTAFIYDGKEIKMLEQPKDYVLKAVDSVFYFTHGKESKNDFVIDSTVSHKTNGVISLTMDNGKVVEFKDGLYNDYKIETVFSYAGENKKSGYYMVESNYENTYIINKKTNAIDTLGGIPVTGPSFMKNNYCFFNCNRHMCFFGFKISNVKNVFMMMALFLMDNYRWVNDHCILFKAKTDGEKPSEKNPVKYYLLEVKIK